MTMTSHAMRYAQRRLTRKLIRAMPLLGAVVAIATVGAAMRRKGVVNGAVDTALDFTPFVGFVKNAVEIVRGRDLIADRPAGPRPPVGGRG
jgi:putative toxin of predicted polymorphic toxin system